MEEFTGRFIQLATRPLAGSEAARDAATGELTSRIAHAGQDEAALQEATARLETKKPAPAWRLPLVTGVALASLAIALGFLIPQHWQEARLLEPIHRQGADNRDYLKRVFAAMGPAADDVPLQAIYFHDQPAWKEQVEALLAEDPRDPARYRFYTSWYNYMYPGRHFPPGYRERWLELDPDNALWAIAAAGHLAGESTKQARGALSVVNEPLFQEALVWFEDAARCTRCSPLSAPVRKRQLRSFHDDGSLKSTFMKAALNSQVPDDRFPLYPLSGLIALDADRRAAAGDRDGLARRIADFKKVLGLVAAAPAEGNGTVPMFLMMRGRQMESACGTLGLAAEAEWLKKLGDLAAKHSPRPGPPSPFARQESTLNRWFSEALGVTPADLTPGRMAEYAVADRFTAVTGALVALLLLAGSSLEIMRRGTGVRGLARGLAPLFRGSDFGWLFGLGLVAPLAWWIGIVRFSPLGCRDMGLAVFQFKSTPLMQPWLSQSLGGLIFLVVMLVQTARWRIARRAAFLALTPPAMWIGWTMAAVAGLFVPLMGIVRYLPGHQEEFLLYASAAGGIPLLWLGWRAAMTLTSPRDNALGGQIALRLLLPAWIAMAVVMLAVMPLLRTRERAWLALEARAFPAPEGSASTELERRASEPKRLELLEALK